MLKSILFLLLIICPVTCFTQPDLLDPGSDHTNFFTDMERSLLRSLDNQYVEKAGIGKDYVNGAEYMPYYLNSENIPLLRPGEARTASLVFNRRVFDNLNLQYDTFQGKLLYAESLIYNNRMNQIELNENNIRSFILCFRNDTLAFRYFSKEISPDFNLEKGFYEVVHDGRYKYIISHGADHAVMQGVDEYFYKPVGYIMLDNEFIRINPRKQFANLFGSRAKEIKQYMTQRRIRIYKADKHQIADIIRYYESITADSR